MCNFCCTFGTPLPQTSLGWVSTPKVRSRTAERTQRERKNEDG